MCQVPSSSDCYIEAKACKGVYERWAPSMQQCSPNNVLEAGIAGVIMEILICGNIGPALSEISATSLHSDANPDPSIFPLSRSLNS